MADNPERTPLPEHFVPFEQGNQLAHRHGGFSTLALDDRVAEIADLLYADLGGHVAPRFVAFVQAAAMAYARLERIWKALNDLDPGESSERLAIELSRWWRNWTAALDRLGMSHLAASKLGLHLAQAGEATQTSLKRRAEIALAERLRSEAERSDG